MFLRPLSQAASALVFFSRRTDMPYRYTTSLAKLGFPEKAVYEVSPAFTPRLPPLLPAFLPFDTGCGLGTEIGTSR